MRHLTLLLLSILVISCSKETSTNCDTFQTAFIEFDDAEAKLVFDEYCDDLDADVTAEDPEGHKENTNILIDRIQEDCDIQVVLLSYATIETWPTQSEIKISFTKDGVFTERIVDLLNDPDGKLAYAGMHE